MQKVIRFYVGLSPKQAILDSEFITISGIKFYGDKTLSDWGREIRRQAIIAVSSVFDGFTIIEATGYWKGNEEKSLIFEVLTELPEQYVVDMAKRLQKYCSQDSVLYTVSSVNYGFSE